MTFNETTENCDLLTDPQTIQPPESNIENRISELSDNQFSILNEYLCTSGLFFPIYLEASAIKNDEELTMLREAYYLENAKGAAITLSLIKADNDLLITLRSLDKKISTIIEEYNESQTKIKLDLLIAYFISGIIKSEQFKRYKDRPGDMANSFLYV